MRIKSRVNRRIKDKMKFWLKSKGQLKIKTFYKRLSKIKSKQSKKLLVKEKKIN